MKARLAAVILAVVLVTAGCARGTPTPVPQGTEQEEQATPGQTERSLQQGAGQQEAER